MSGMKDAFYGDRPAPGHYPSQPGFKSGDTSREAAETVAGGASEVREAVFKAIDAASPAGVTADEAAEKIGRKPAYVRPRLSELSAANRIVPTGARRKNPDTGLSAKVWRSVS